MATVSIKKGDEIMVMAGKDRGRSGRVVNVLPARGRIMVEGVARAKKATRPSRKRQQGGIIDIEQFIDISNVQLLCPSCHKPTRVGYRFEGTDKIRICRKCGADI
ncbi:MAG TPA: 50S ribosomal protein L24 [Actinomycetota bacterium]|nr:50S ribosomal protein L24 [Actinomycetota bacterium]